ncbi:hypothetical protein PHYSODRAFT_434710, partial [Phytophthora sojae]
MLPTHNRSVSALSGSAIAAFLLSEGMQLAPSAISRIKAAIDALTWATAHGDDELAPFLREKRDQLAAATSFCKITPCLEGSYMVRYMGPSKHDGYIHPWRHVDLPARSCTCGGWEDFEFPCVHAVCAAIREGTRISSVYDAKRLSIKHFTATYTKRFIPLPIDGQLRIDTTLKLPALQIPPLQKGKRGL